MDREKENKIMKLMRKKKMEALKEEFNQLNTEQKELRAEEKELEELRSELYVKLYAAMKVGGMEDEEKLLNKQIADITARIKEIDARHKANGEVIELYSRVEKNKREAGSSILGTIFGGLGTGGVIWLANKSLNKAYEYEQEGLMVNKKSLDVFNKLNPMRLIMLIHKTTK